MLRKLLSCFLRPKVRPKVDAWDLDFLWEYWDPWDIVDGVLQVNLVCDDWDQWGDIWGGHGLCRDGGIPAGLYMKPLIRARINGKKDIKDLERLLKSKIKIRLGLESPGDMMIPTGLLKKIKVEGHETHMDKSIRIQYPYLLMSLHF